MIQRIGDVNLSLQDGRSLSDLPDALPFNQAMAKATLLTIREQAAKAGCMTAGRPCAVQAGEARLMIVYAAFASQLVLDDVTIEQGVLMSPLPSYPRGMYFEEFQAGQVITSVGRTITEADIVNFAGLSGDFTQIHTDAEYSKQSLAGQRIAHGLLVLSIASGLAAQTGVLEGTVIVFREINEWKFIQPVYIGDTIHVELVVLETKAMRRVGGGTVTIELKVKNQSEQTVMKGTWTVLMASRPE